MTLLLCLLFFFGYLALRNHPQALAFLAIGAGYALVSAAFPAPDAAPADPAGTVLVTTFSALGYVAWRASRKRLESTRLLSKQRLLIFLGWGANGLLFAFILWLTGTITLAG